MSNPAFVRWFNRLNPWLLRYPIRVEHQQGAGYFAVHDDMGESLYFVNKHMVRRYKNGVDDRLQRLAEEYFFSHCDIKAGDLVVDIGANIGEFSRYCGLMAGARAIAIEPESACWQALSMNLRKIDAIRIEKALWEQSGRFKIYHRQATNDTSLIEMDCYDYAEVIEVTTLDQVLTQLGDALGRPLDQIKLIKIESEGAEPEIIAGGRSALERAEFVAVDCGPERGIRKESTLVPVVNQLSELGFELRDFFYNRTIILFQKRHTHARCKRICD